MQPANLLKIHSLDEEWRDKDVVMLHACFQLLEDCVHEEKLLDGHIDWDYNDEFRRARVELQALYDWWQKRKNPASEEGDEREEPDYEEDTRRLKQLIEWRHMLWT